MSKKAQTTRHGRATSIFPSAETKKGDRSKRVMPDKTKQTITQLFTFIKTVDPSEYIDTMSQERSGGSAVVSDTAIDAREVYFQFILNTPQGRSIARDRIDELRAHFEAMFNVATSNRPLPPTSIWSSGPKDGGLLKPAPSSVDAELRRLRSRYEENFGFDAAKSAFMKLAEGTEPHGRREVPRPDSAPREEIVSTQDGGNEIAATIELLSTLGLKDRRLFLDERYSTRKPWDSVRSANPTPDDMVVWADANFRDRHELGLVLSDLKYLDSQAYRRILNWHRPREGHPPAVLPAALGFPTKQGRYETEEFLQSAPTGAEVYAALKRGDPTNYMVMNRLRSAASYHLRKKLKPPAKER